MWPVDHDRMQSIQSCVSFPNLSCLVFLHNRVSAIWACAWPGHIWAAAVQTSPSIFLPAADTVNELFACVLFDAFFDAYTNLFIPVINIKLGTNWFLSKKLTTQNLWWSIYTIFVTSGTFRPNEQDDWWLCRSFVSAVRCSVSRTLCSFSPDSPFHPGCTIRLGRKDGLLPCWHRLHTTQLAEVLNILQTP